MTVKEIMSKWPDRGVFARDIGITQSHANVMAVRDSIPSKYWNKVVSAAKKRGIIGISLRSLGRLAERKTKAA